MKMKKRLLILGVLLIAIGCVGAGTLAYTNQKAHNVITSGGVKVALIEQRNNEGATVDFPKDGISGVAPGASSSKIVSVRNVGESEAWVRVKVKWTLQDQSGNPLPDTVTKSDGTTVDVIRLAVNEEHWIDGNDGFYYYKHPVPAEGNNTTEILFDTVEFSEEMDNRYQGCISNVIVQAQAVQTANNPIPAGKDVTAVLGWPEK